MSNTPLSAKEFWEVYLRGRIRDNLERGTLQNETVVAQRLLVRGEQLQPFYEAIHPGLDNNGVCWEVLLRRLLKIGAEENRPLSGLSAMADLHINLRLIISSVLSTLLEEIERNKGEWLGAIPCDFEMSDAALAALINVLLELPPNMAIRSEYVNNERHLRCSFLTD